LRYRAGPKIPKGHARVFWDLDETDYTGVAVVGLGKQGLGINKLEEIHEGKESVRAAAAGILNIQIMYYANNHFIYYSSLDRTSKSIFQHTKLERFLIYLDFNTLCSKNKIRVCFV